MGDNISRQSVLDAITASINQYGGRYTAEQLNMWGLFAQMVKEIPPTESESFEWCTDCKEYDQEAHCCHRWSKMIRKTVEEMKLVHCIDCQHSEYDSVYGERWCHYNGKAEIVDDYHYCSYADRREVTT